jgi:hypothetical protein
MVKAAGRVPRVLSLAINTKETISMIRNRATGCLPGPVATHTRDSIERMKEMGLER